MARAKRQKTVHNDSKTMGSNAHAWADLPAQLEQAMPKANEIAQADGQLKAFTTTNAVQEPTTFGVKAAGSDSTITATINNGTCKIGTGNPSDCAFVLSALPEVSVSRRCSQTAHEGLDLTFCTAMARVYETNTGRSLPVLLGTSHFDQSIEGQANISRVCSE